jgi:hypothetical protein
MRRAIDVSLAILAVLACFAHAARAQGSAASLDITARVSPTAAKPEPVRQFTLYILTKSYTDIAKEIEAGDVIPPRNDFIDGLKVSKELKAWLKTHDTLDLTAPDLDKLLKPDDIIHTPEFLLAYQHTNSGGVTKDIPKPKYKDADKETHPEKYEKIYYRESGNGFRRGAGTKRHKSADKVGADPEQSEEARAEACSGSGTKEISCGQGRYGPGRARLPPGAGARQLLD